MKRTRNKASPPRLTREAEKLALLSVGLSASGSHLEDRFWQQRLSETVAHALDQGADVGLEGALDHLYAGHGEAYDALIDTAEAQAESAVLGNDDVLLIAAPILAWSKYSIYSGPLRSELIDALKAHLHGHVLAQDVRVAIAPYLYSIDQLPQRFSKTRELMRELGQRAQGSRERPLSKRSLPPTAPLLSDTRYVIAALAVPQGQPLFAWQEGASERQRNAVDRETVLGRWREAVVPLLASVLTGCTTDVLVPDAYHSSCRESDRAVRAFGIRAGVAFLEGALTLEAAKLRAVVALFGDQRGEEYRIGLALQDGSEILHGVVWPLFGREEGPEPDGPRDQIEALLKDCGVADCLFVDTLFPLEFCEDCGAPLFADPAGELVHPELPEDAEEPRAHFH